tara:strand:+ start:67 stop:273 length:207 start_codon:yes stop_codon:yes gene_type:complete
MVNKIEGLSLKDLEFYKEPYFAHFGEKINTDEGMGSISTFMEGIEKAIQTNTPLYNYDLPDEASLYAI